MRAFKKDTYIHKHSNIHIYSMCEDYTICSQNWHEITRESQEDKEKVNSGFENIIPRFSFSLVRIWQTLLIIFLG